MIYLDNNATTQVDPDVIEAMEPFFRTYFANPSSLHFFGHSVSDKVEEVRSLIAQNIGCNSDEILFTSSGSEANNLCLKGYAFANRHRGNHLITSTIEHVSVLNSCAFLESQGFEVTYLDVNEEGFIIPETLQKAIKEETILISIAHVNNEIGTIQPLNELLAVSGDVPFHTDAVQSFLKTDFNVQNLNVALASFSGHKFHAPKGIGFIFKRKGIALAPQIHGGQQENELRAGTENVPYIIGLGKAIEKWDQKDVLHMKRLQTYLLGELKKIRGVKINGPEELDKRVCTNLNISLDVLEGESILHALSMDGICISTGSACHSKHSRISHVLQGIKCPPRFIHGNIRIGLSKYTSQQDVEAFLDRFLSLTSADFPFRLYACL